MASGHTQTLCPLLCALTTISQLAIFVTPPNRYALLVNGFIVTITTYADICRNALATDRPVQDVPLVDGPVDTHLVNADVPYPKNNAGRQSRMINHASHQCRSHRRNK